MARDANHQHEFTPMDQGARQRRLLSKIRGLTLENGYQGTFKVGSHAARLRIEPGDCLRVHHEVEDPPPPHVALEANYQLPGNVRFAASGGQTAVVADTRLDGELHLAGSFREIREGLRDALQMHRKPHLHRNGVITPGQVQAALDGAGLDEEAIVRLDNGWEVRMRIRGESRAVRLVIEGRNLRISRVVVPSCHETNHRAVACQALFFNARLRHARLARHKDTVVADTCLHSGLIDSIWLVHACRAVATAAFYCGTILEILASQPDVARSFENMFLDTFDLCARKEPGSPAGVWQIPSGIVNE
ncbi:MAG: hypothetical protein JW829_07905 [Pirellulales bacterium]|nr:hypothetical protein [Pirellulales bacterium]